jgi:hypothetical protein
MSWSGYPEIDLLPEGYPALHPPPYGVAYLPMTPPPPPPVPIPGPHGVPRGWRGHARQLASVLQSCRTGYCTERCPIKG